MCLLDIGNWDPSKYDVFHVIGASVSLYEQAALSRATQINGFVAVVDLRNSCMKHLLSISLESIKLAADLTEHALPIKFDKIHIVYQNRITDVIYSLARPFLSKELSNRIVFHGDDLKGLHRQISPALLPPDLGGKFRSYHAINYYNVQLRQSEEQLKRIWNCYQV